MISQTGILLALVIFAPSISTRAQQASTSQTSVADPMLSDESFNRGIDAMYNLDFEEARKRFEEVRQRFPDDPAGPYYLAANLFLRTLTKPSHLLPLLSNLSGSETFGGNAGRRQSRRRHSAALSRLDAASATAGQSAPPSRL